ncbi:hypothetical protein LOZ36_006014 [Ophidiomyces ophidiicola]|nr:hypothetical protein LOZ36_006014 [Ophidiomyces ophidiicola]
MSASNPFRRKPVPAAAAALDSVVGEREAAPTTPDPAPAPPAPPLENTLPPRTKSVRIASPPVRAVISPVEPLSPLATSPPGTSHGRSRHAGSPPPPQVIPRDVESSSESEDDERPDGLDPFENPKARSDNDDDDVQTGRKRATMDVDAFKRLLLTGDASVQSAALTETNVSLIEQQQQLPLRSASRSSQDRDAASPRLERKKPPVPKTRHGKLLQHAVDEDVVSARDQQSRAPPRVVLSKKSPPPPLTFSPSPYPPAGAAARVVSDPPPSTSSPGSSSRSSSRDGRRPSLSDPFPPFRSASQRIPPAAPPTRRHSQLRHAHAHAHAAAGSSPPIARSSSARLPASSTSSSASAMPRTPPPPPPTRRRDHESPPSSSHSSPSTTPEEAADTDADNQSTTPPPLARSQSGSVRSVNRLARAPRPPPPRRSANSQVAAADDSRSLRHVSGDGDAEDDGGGVGSPPRPPSKAENILADLSRLQRELDEFRGRYEKPSSSTSSAAG